MVRGNWQRRVELNEARRDEAKQRKLRTEEKKLFKQKAQKFLATLDDNKDIAWQKVEKRWELHIWVDTLPSDQDPSEPTLEEEMDPKAFKRRNRSASIESESPSKPYRGRGGKAKKKHPNSKKNVEQAPVEEPSITPQLSRKYFFRGQQEQRKCGKKRGGDNKRAQYPKGFKSLAEVILKGVESKQQVKEVLFSTESAYPDAQVDEDTATTGEPLMEILYYFSIPAPDEVSGGKISSFSELIGGVLSKKSCNIGSVVYVTFNKTLIFDRYREGLLLPEYDLRNCISMGKSATSSSDSSSDLAKTIPGPVLEYILTFSSEFENARMRRVCRSWNEQIGKDSANIWRHFLERRQWPVSTSVDLEHNLHHQSFLSHYGVVRDLKAIQLGLSDVLAKKTSTSNEVVSRSYGTYKNSLQFPNDSEILAIWSSNQVIIAYSDECTLRLFSKVERGVSNGDKFCREMICQNIDPYRNTKKMTCRLVDLALDDSLIGCMCKIEENTEDTTTSLLLLSRDDFLTSDIAEEEDMLQIIGLENTILDFLLAYDGVDNDPMELLSYISAGGEIEDVEVLVSPSLVACGNGLFLFHGSWSIPAVDGAEVGERFFKKLFMLSAGAGAIVLMKSLDLSTQMNEAHESFVLASKVTTDEKGLSECAFAASSAVSLSLTVGSIDSYGVIHSLSLPTYFPDGYSLCPQKQRPMAILGSITVVADAMVENNEDESIKNYKSTMSFHSLPNDGTDAFTQSIEMEGNLEVTKLVSFRDEHVLVICHLHPATGDEDIDAIDGHWFGPPAETDVSASLIGIVYHVPSRTEIHRLSLLSQHDNSFVLPFDIAVHEHTVAASVCCKGLLMTGEDVRERQNHCRDQELLGTPNSKAKKKKKKTPKKGGKKDGFARGMSLRG